MPTPPQPHTLEPDRSFTPHLVALIRYAIKHGASDLHVQVGVPPVVRIDGTLRSVPKEPVYTPEAAAADAQSALAPAQRDRLRAEREVDFSFSFESVRLRANVFHERGNVVGAFRLIPIQIRTLEELGLPSVLRQLTARKQGFLIISGPTGHGKSTTLAALVDDINTTRPEHIITIEDPIEYVFQSRQSIVSQREVGADTKSFAAALRSAMRQDPNVLLVGEMRDLETMEAALTLAETGHLILTTLHTNSAAETAHRIIDVFPPHQQPQIQAQLASVLIGVVSQRLIARIGGGRVAAAEIMTVTPAVRNVIREGKIHQLDNIIQTGASEGMINLDTVLAGLVSQGEITIDDAEHWAHDPRQLKIKLYS